VLKFVVGNENVEELIKEHDVLKAYGEGNYHGLVSLCLDCPFVEVEFEVNGVNSCAAGYVMSTIGRPVPYSTAEEKRKIFNSLRELHRQGIVHGDARRQNVIMTGKETILWVDFMASKVINSASQFLTDDRTLLQSLYGEYKGKPIRLRELLFSYYRNDCGVDTMDALLTAYQNPTGTQKDFLSLSK
jgi:hypothetical protein